MPPSLVNNLSTGLPVAIGSNKIGSNCWSFMRTNSKGLVRVGSPDAGAMPISRRLRAAEALTASAMRAFDSADMGLRVPVVFDFLGIANSWLVVVEYTVLNFSCG
jgi:hypothetical protein